MDVRAAWIVEISAPFAPNKIGPTLANTLRGLGPRWGVFRYQGVGEMKIVVPLYEGVFCENSGGADSFAFYAMDEALTDVATEYLANVSFTTAVIEGRAAVGVTSFAENNNLDPVVLATRGFTGLSHAVPDSVAERVVSLPKVPALTIRGNS